MPQAIASALDQAGGVRGLVQGIPSERELKKVARQHQSLADHTRLKILWALSNMDLCPCVLKVIAGVSDSRLSYHLKILESARLIKAKRTKNWRIYTITDEGEASLVLDKADTP
jgi:ArsR family transcriptional regulator